MGNIGTEGVVDVAAEGVEEVEAGEGEAVEGRGGCVSCRAGVVVSASWLSWIPRLVSWETGRVSCPSLLSW